jgi:hypothetical protein
MAFSKLSNVSYLGFLVVLVSILLSQLQYGGGGGVQAGSAGANSCAADGQAAATTHTGNFGALSVIPVTVKINEVALVPNTVFTIAPGQSVTISVDGTINGILIRINDGATLQVVDGVTTKIADVCVAPVVGITHTAKDPKTRVQATLTPTVQSGTLTMDVIIVNAYAGYYYNTYPLSVAAVPVPAPVVVPVPVPVVVPVPVPAPVVVPVPVPLPVPVVVPVPVVPTPIAPVAPVPTVPTPIAPLAPVPMIVTTAPVRAPTKSPSVRHDTAPSLRNPTESLPEQRSAGSFSVFSVAFGSPPTASTTSTATTATATTSTSTSTSSTTTSSSVSDPIVASRGTDASPNNGRKSNNLGQLLRNFVGF